MNFLDLETLGIYRSRLHNRCAAYLLDLSLQAEQMFLMLIRELA
jgi:hypothetical protein